MFFQILRSLERLSTELALMRFERDVDSDMGCDMVALDGGCSTLTPSAGQVKIVG